MCLVVLEAREGAAELLRRLHPDDAELPFPMVVVAERGTDLRELRRHHETVEVVREEDLDLRRLERAVEGAAAHFAARRETATSLDEPSLLEAVLAAAPVGILVADQTGRVVRINPANERIWGKAPPTESVAQYGAWKGWWADGSDRHGRRLTGEEWAMARALRGETARGDIVEIEPFGQPGTRRTIVNSGAPVRGEDDRIVGAVVVQMDITERVAAEAAVRLSDERLRLVNRATNDVVWDWDFASDRIAWNDAVVAHFGETPESLGPGIHDWALRLHPEDRGRVEQSLQAAIDGGAESWTDEYRFRRHDGVWVPVLDRGYILRDASGKGTRMIGTMLDLTDRRRAEEALEESESRFRTLADNISQLVWMADESGAIVWFNRRWFEYTGTTAAEVLGRGWRDVLDPAERPRVEETFHRAIESGEEWEDTFKMRGKDGRFRSFLTRAMPVYDAQRRVVGWFGTNTDVEEQYRYAGALRQAVTMRDTFLQIAAHELRTPLTALGLQLETLDWLAKRAVVEPGRIATKVQLALRQTERLGRLVEDLLDVSRITSGRLKLEVADVDLTAVVSESMDRMRELAARAGCELRADLPANAVLGRWDRSRMEQVVTNLLTNAIKYGRGQPVDVTMTKSDEEIEIHVRDRGIGISAADQARIFGRFERAVSPDHYGGLGLGLYIAREIVRAHGGRIFVESSTPGGGSTFTVCLPQRG